MQKIRVFSYCDECQTLLIHLVSLRSYGKNGWELEKLAQEEVVEHHDWVHDGGDNLYCPKHAHLVKENK